MAPRNKYFLILGFYVMGETTQVDELHVEAANKDAALHAFFEHVTFEREHYWQTNWYELPSKPVDEGLA